MRASSRRESAGRFGENADLRKTSAQRFDEIAEV